MRLNPSFGVEDIFLGTTFEDFTLNPQCSITEHRDAPLKTKFSKNISLNLPVVSANMRTVTGPTMAITLAQEGGIGILPRMGVPIDTEAKWVEEVKRSENFIIENPYTIKQSQTLGEARSVMELRGVGTLLVVDENNQFVGILSTRRKIKLHGRDDNNQIVAELMTPADKKNYTQEENICSAEEAAMELEKFDQEKLPWLFKDMKIRGLITTKDISNLLHHKWANKDKRGRLIVGAAIGVTGDYMERAAELIKADVDVIVMDTAHAHNQKVVRPAIEQFRKKFGKFELVCGNVATSEGAKFLNDIVDGIKVGIGPGAGCWTRNETGVGVGQLDAIRCTFLASNKPVIADGGIVRVGDMAKALCAGASSVMLGQFLAGTDESPGEIINDPVKGRIKIYAGETSPQTKLADVGSANNIKNVEGYQKEIKYHGSARDLLKKIREGLQSMVSYMGESDLEGVLRKVNADPRRYFRPSSPATQRESFER